MVVQIAFLRALVERLQCPPLWNKLVNRRGTYFQRLDPKRAPVLGMPKLLRRCCFFSLGSAVIAAERYLAQVQSCYFKLQRPARSGGKLHG